MLSTIKEFREFFLRNTVVNTGSKPDQEINYPVTYTTTNLLGQILTVYNRFIKNNYPTADVFSKLYSSITFKLNPEDTATTNIQGIVKVATDADAYAKTASFGDSMTRVLLPYQAADVLVDSTTGNISVSKGYVPIGTGIWQSGLPNVPYRIGYKIANVFGETWKLIGASGNMANGQPIPAFATHIAGGGGGNTSLQIRMTSTGKLAIRGFANLSSSPTSPALLFTLPTGYRVAANVIASVNTYTLTLTPGAIDDAPIIFIANDGTVKFEFNGTASASGLIYIPEQEISLI